MIEENERAAKFMQAIQRDGEKRRAAIIQAIDEEIAAELEKVKTDAAAKAKQMGDYEKVRLQEDTNRKLSHSVLETGAELATRRNEIEQQVFDACEERLAQFTAKPEYTDYLRTSAEALLQLLGVLEEQGLRINVSSIDITSTRITMQYDGRFSLKLLLKDFRSENP